MLIAVDEGLAEEAELVIDAVTEAGEVLRGQRVEEAGREAAEATVAEGGIVLEGAELLQIGAELGDDRLGLVVQLEVGQIVPEGAAHEKLHRKVIEALGILIAIPPLRLPHGIEHRPADGDGERVQPLPHRGLLPDLSPRKAKKGLDAFTKVHETAGDVAFGWGGYRAHRCIIARLLVVILREDAGSPVIPRRCCPTPDSRGATGDPASSRRMRVRQRASHITNPRTTSKSACTHPPSSSVRRSRGSRRDRAPAPSSTCAARSGAGPGGCCPGNARSCRPCRGRSAGVPSVPARSRSATISGRPRRRSAGG